MHPTHPHRLRYNVTTASTLLDTMAQHVHVRHNITIKCQCKSSQRQDAQRRGVVGGWRRALDAPARARSVYASARLSDHTAALKPQRATAGDRRGGRQAGVSIRVAVRKRRKRQRGSAPSPVADRHCRHTQPGCLTRPHYTTTGEGGRHPPTR